MTEIDTFWLEENTTELVESGMECPECGSELMIDDNDTAYCPIYRYREWHRVTCSNDCCNYMDKVKIQYD
jgi:hypothetical protein